MSTYISLFSTKLLVPRAEKHFMCKESMISVWWLTHSTISVMLEHLVINISHQKALIELKRFNKSNFFSVFNANSDAEWAMFKSTVEWKV